MKYQENSARSQTTHSLEHEVQSDVGFGKVVCYDEGDCVLVQSLNYDPVQIALKRARLGSGHESPISCMVQQAAFSIKKNLIFSKEGGVLWGYVWKKAATPGVWKRRFLRLTPRQLSWHETETSKQLGEVSLQDCTMECVALQQPHVDSRYKFRMLFISKHRKILFAMGSREEALGWSRTIRATVRSKNGYSSDPYFLSPELVTNGTYDEEF